MLLSAFKLTSDAIIVVDLKGIILDVNDSFLKMFKIPLREQVIGMDGLSLLRDTKPQEISERVEQLLIKDNIVGKEYDVMDMEGNQLRVNTTSAVLKDENNKPRGILVTAKNVTR
jgi:PAS domain S-box-containing protein